MEDLCSKLQLCITQEDDISTDITTFTSNYLNVIECIKSNGLASMIDVPMKPESINKLVDQIDTYTQFLNNKINAINDIKNKLIHMNEGKSSNSNPIAQYNSNNSNNTLIIEEEPKNQEEYRRVLRRNSARTKRLFAISYKNMYIPLKTFLTNHMKDKPIQTIKSCVALFKLYGGESKIRASVFAKAYDIMLEYFEKELKDSNVNKKNNHEKKNKSYNKSSTKSRRKKKSSKRYTAEQEKFLKEHLKGEPDPETITELFNDKFNQDRSVSGITQKLVKYVPDNQPNKKRKLLQLGCNQYKKKRKLNLE